LCQCHFVQHKSHTDSLGRIRLWVCYKHLILSNLYNSNFKIIRLTPTIIRQRYSKTQNNMTYCIKIISLKKKEAMLMRRLHVVKPHPHRKSQREIKFGLYRPFKSLTKSNKFLRNASSSSRHRYTVLKKEMSLGTLCDTMLPSR
jgi:hypothetical protein